MKNIATDRASLGYASAALFNFVFLLCLNAHAVWRPWLGGLVTEAFGEVVWAINVVLVVQIFGDLLLSVTHPKPLQRFVDLLTAMAAVLAAFSLYRVFPLDLMRFGHWVSMVARMTMVATVLAASLAAGINFVRFMRVSREDEPQRQGAHT